MEILRKTTNQNIILNTEQTFKTDLGWTENAEILEREVLYDIINPTENYETVRYIHSPYEAMTPQDNVYTQTDIWFYFYFNRYYYNMSNPLNPILTGVTREQDYRLVDITLQENALMLKQSTESFFRLEFYKTPNDEAPNNANRRMVFAKNLSLPLGEKVFYTGTTSGSTISLNDYIYFPVFTGSNYRNKENMYFFWFTDDSPFSETTITGNTFYMTAKFYNAKDGTVMDFTNKDLPFVDEIVEEEDMYYKVVINRTDFSYQIFEFNGSVGPRIGKTGDPIVFYEKIR
jgi:hypothetical protein